MALKADFKKSLFTIINIRFLRHTSLKLTAGLQFIDFRDRKESPAKKRIITDSGDLQSSRTQHLQSSPLERHNPRYVYGNIHFFYTVLVIGNNAYASRNPQMESSTRAVEEWMQRAAFRSLPSPAITHPLLPRNDPS